MATRTTDGQVEQTTSALEEVLCNGARQLIREAVEAELAELLAHHGNVRLLNGRRAVVRGRLPARARGAHRRWSGARAHSEGARPLGRARQVQLQPGAALCAPLSPRVGGTAMAVPQGHLHGRHARRFRGAAG